VSEIKKDSEEAYDAAWNRLFLALGGLALAAGSIEPYFRGDYATGATLTAMSGAALFAANKIKGPE
jgi:hypothetical protein